ncbi:MAG: helix-turn-helix transcriptional regulator [Burkholderiales bacterium]
MKVTAIHKGGDFAVENFACDARPGDKPYQEMHRIHALCFVKQGSFGCCTMGKQHELIAGSVFIARPGQEYTAIHDHHDCGDECLSVRMSPQFAETLRMGKAWDYAKLPPIPELMVAGELMRAAAERKTDVGVDEAALHFTHTLASIAADKAPGIPKGTDKDRRRAVEAARWLDENHAEEVDLEQTAQQAGVSPFHFLRTFTNALGVTPHQYLVRTRLRHAARLLKTTDRTVTDVALDVGFADLSNFVRTFHRAAGVPPGKFRSKNLQEAKARAA